jgi:hypothetical protein
LCSRYIESVSTPSPPPTRLNSSLARRWANFYTQVTGNRAWGQVFIFSSGPTHPPTPRPFSSPYPSALLIPLPLGLLIPLPLGPIHPPTPRPYSSPYPSALLIPLTLGPIHPPTPSEKETLPSVQCPVTSRS